MSAAARRVPASRRRRLGLAAKLTLTQAAVLIVAFASLSPLADMFFRPTLDGIARERFEREVEHQLACTRAQGSPCVSAGWVVRVSSQTNETLAFQPVAGAPSERALASLERVTRTELVVDQAVWRIGARPLGDGGYLQLGESDAWRRSLVGDLRRAMLWAFLLVLPVFGLGMWWTRRTVARLRSVATAMEEIAETGDFTTRAEVPPTGDELEVLTRAFNRMVERNRRLVEGMRHALDDVAHDLRTPLTRLRGEAELALTTTEADPDRALATVLEQTDSLLSMLRTLMDISEAEAGVMRLELELVDLRALVEQTIELYELIADEKGVELVLLAPPSLSVRADRNQLRRAFANVLDNAIKYTPSGGRVELELSADGDRATLTVRDTGQGIDPGDLDRVFDRLFRADSSRSEQGLGLGLSLVRAIARAHGGSARAESEGPGQGAAISITLPRGLT